MELIAGGWPSMAAARLFGIIRSVAYIWRDEATVRDKNRTM